MTESNTFNHRVHIIVTGIVQGVFFRDFTRCQALSLDLKGWVKNTSDGKVEIVAEGSKEKLLQLIEAVKIGPTAAVVKDCKINWCKYVGEFESFQIVY